MAVTTHLSDRTGPIRFSWLCGFALSALITGSSHPAIAQGPTPIQSPAAQKPLTPPVPLESGPVQSFSTVSATVPPLSIGPAPAFYPPPPIYSFSGRPIYAGPQVVGGPVPGPPVFLGPPPVVAPSPFTANFAPDQSRPGQPVPDPISTTEIQRPSGPANFRLTVSETFLNRLVARENVQPGQVRDVILGAQVTGKSTTVSKLHVDLVPDANQGHAVFVLNGDVQTLTTGVTPQAMIDTAGQQQFVAVKDVFFDGMKFSTRHATVFIRARNQTVGAVTPLSGTLFGGLADRIAYRAAERQKAAGEAVARERLAERLFPTFDGEVDAQLGQGNRQLESVVRKGLETVKLMPTSQSVWTTDTQLIHEAYIGSDASGLSISPPADSTDGISGLRISVHETLLNTLVDRAALKGFTITDKQLRELEQPYVVDEAAAGNAGPTSDRRGGSFDLPALPAGTDNFVTDIVFDDVEPLKLRVDGDRLIATIKASFKPGGQSLVPAMSITIPYQTRIVGDKIRLIAGKPRVVTQDRTDPDAPPSIVETTIEKLIHAELTPLEFDRKLPAGLWPASGIPPQISSIKSENGWIHIVVE